MPMGSSPSPVSTGAGRHLVHLMNQDHADEARASSSVQLELELTYSMNMLRPPQHSEHME
jgi:hypothetical protein